jgi:hypothetical protein
LSAAHPIASTFPIEHGDMPALLAPQLGEVVNDG